MDGGIFKLRTASLTSHLSFTASHSLTKYTFLYLLHFSSDLTSPSYFSTLFHVEVRWNPNLEPPEIKTVINFYILHPPAGIDYGSCIVGLLVQQWNIALWRLMWEWSERSVPSYPWYYIIIHKWSVIRSSHRTSGERATGTSWTRGLFVFQNWFGRKGGQKYSCICWK